jgi:hypothetical protein
MGSVPSSISAKSGTTTDATCREQPTEPQRHDPVAASETKSSTAADDLPNNKRGKNTTGIDTNGLTGMPLVHYKCRRKKKRYDKCVNQHYREFVTGESRSEGEVCHDTFDAYRTCVLKGIKKEIWEKEGLPPPKEGSPLAELE